MADTTDVDFPLIRNGMDYLITVGEALRAFDQARGMKYAVLSLHAATELLLKWPLMRHDWRLVALPHKGDVICDERDFRAGCCPSIGIGPTLRLLGDTLGIVVSRSDRRAIEKLGKSRNKLQHFEMTASVEVVKPQAEKVLVFLLDFVHHHLPGYLDPQDAEHVDEQISIVRSVLHEMETFVETKMQKLRLQLDARRHPVVECPECGQYAATVDAYNVTTTCLFCHSSWDSEAAAAAYALEILGLSSYEAAIEGGDDPVLNCPNCDLRTFVRDARLAASPGEPQDFCFNCAEQFPDMALCHNGCGTPIDPDTTICTSCLHIIVGKSER
uniref:hypothetical protein n=1 Tax=Streptomyces flavovirens TaxID=52258 RepID=UPI00131D25E9|nr:hypothetical protein [Streptomyces flavovirens]